MGRGGSEGSLLMCIVAEEGTSSKWMLFHLGEGVLTLPSLHPRHPINPLCNHFVGQTLIAKPPKQQYYHPDFYPTLFKETAKC